MSRTKTSGLTKEIKIKRCYGCGQGKETVLLTFLLRIAIVDVQYSIEWENPEQLSVIKNSSRKVHMVQ